MPHGPMVAELNKIHKKKGRGKFLAFRHELIFIDIFRMVLGIFFGFLLPEIKAEQNVI